MAEVSDFRRMKFIKLCASGVAPYRAAIDAGYSEKYAKTNAHIMLEKYEKEIEELKIEVQKELKEEVQCLSGALKLCETLLSQDIDNLSPDQIDRYLEYVYEEEEKGTRFIEVTELLEDITDYTIATLPHLPFLWTTNKPWIPTVFAIVFWGMFSAVPIAHLIDVAIGKDTLSISLLVVYAVIMIIYVYGFIKFRRIRKESAV